MEYQRADFIVSTDTSRLDIERIHGILSNTYWSGGITRQALETSIRNSLCFSVYHETQQVGFARVITDFVGIAYLADVVIVEEYRGRGLSKWLLECILSHPDLQSIRRWLLCTRDAHGLYAQFGFVGLQTPERFMEKLRPLPE